MFGYVRLYKPEIKMGEYEQYRGIYCTLCRRLGRRYGPLARLTLNYDLTFLALLQYALDEASPALCPGRCSFNPAKRCARCRNTAPTDAAADIGMLLTYYKLKDTLRDERGIKKLGALLAYPVAAFHHRKAKKRRPATDEAIARMMDGQAAVEREHCDSIDRAAEPFAAFMRELATELGHDDRERLVLDRFGYCLGRWIYLIDAADDLADDRKKENYNPYLYAPRTRELPDADILVYAGETLNACLAECIAAYELLNIRRFDGICRNILTKGMPAAQKRVISGDL